MKCPWKALAAAVSPLREGGDAAVAPVSGPVADPRDLPGWKAIASGEAELQLGCEAGPEPGSAALRLDFDFHGSGGFAVARYEARLHLPESFAVRFGFRGQGAVNDLEVKWVDQAGSNVWRHVIHLAAWPDAWQMLELRDRDFPFAWGPAGGGRIGGVGALELAIVARNQDGGCGSVWISELVVIDRTIRVPPVFSASSQREGHAPSAAGDPRSEEFWESAEEDAAPFWMVDWQGEREFGGVGIRWARSPIPATLVERSADGENWTELGRLSAGSASGVFLPVEGGSARFLRLRFNQTGEPRTPAVASVELMPPEFGESRDAAYHLLASMAPRGWFPRYWLREQSYWTPFGPPGGSPRGLMNEEGLVEPGGAAFSLEPFLWHDGKLLTWADCRIPLIGQEEGWMPVPAVVWETGTLRLRIDAAATEHGSLARYTVENLSSGAEKVRLFLALRPFQVTPPWQAFRGFGGAGRLEELHREAVDGAVVANGMVLRSLPREAGFGATSSQPGDLLEVMAAGEVPRPDGVGDPAGLASGAMAWDMVLAPGEAQDVEVTITPLQLSADQGENVSLEAAVEAWRQTPLMAPAWCVPAGSAGARDLARIMRAAAAHILVNRDGPALQPGPRRYQRCWIRDAAGMARALLYAGCRNEVRDQLAWYAPHIRDDGTVPCCVDREGPDWLPEHDSQGQFVHVLAEYARYGGDHAQVSALWPVAVRTIERLQAMRETRMTEAHRNGQPPHRFGLLPESASHEGYLAHPVHAYWDDFWALRGLRDAAWLAEELGDLPRGEQIRALRDSFTETLAASLSGLVADRGLDFVPGSVEWADFDPSATANGLALLDELPGVPRSLLEATYSRYLAGFRERRDGKVPWENYTPYEIRVIGALVRLGWRAEAWELLRRFLDDRRPCEWNQWPEIAWRDPRAPGHVGDVPHTWIGAEFVAAARSLFVYERDGDASLVLGAGLPAEWLREPGGLAIRGWPTAHGTLTYATGFRTGTEAFLRLDGGLRVPSGGLLLALPGPARPVEFLVNGIAEPVPDGGELRLRCCPAEVSIRFAHP